MNMNFIILLKLQKTWSVIDFYGETRIIFIKPNMMIYVDNKRSIWFLLENNYCSSCISHEITPMWYIIKLLYCNMSIDDVELHTPHFYVFVWRSCYMPEEVRNITTQSIIILTGERYGILIVKALHLFLWLDYIRISLVILESFVLGLSLLPLG